MSTVNWPLVLEFTKTLAGPVATVAVALIVSALGFRSFRRQKALERRLGWYEEAYEHLDRAAKAFALAPIAAPRDSAEGQKHFDEAMAASTALGEHLARSWLYADVNAHEAVEKLGKTLETVHINVLQQNRIYGNDAQTFANACLETSLVIAEGIRHDLGVRQLPRPT